MKKTFLLTFMLLSSILLSAVSYNSSFDSADLDITTNNRGYDELRFEDFSITQIRTEPELPYKVVKLIIPSGMEVDSLSISTQIDTLSGTFIVNPSPGLDIISEPPTDADPDSTIYSSSSLFPSEPVVVLSHGYFAGGNRIVTLAVYPVQYQPADSILIFNDYLSCTLSLKSSSSPVALPKYRLARYEDMYDDALAALVENDGDISSYEYQPTILNRPTRDIFDIVIIGEDEYASDFADFIEWKLLEDVRVLYISYDTAAFNTNYPYGDNWGSHPINDKAGKIRACLKEYFEDHGTVYAIIVGGTTDFDETPQSNDDDLAVRYACRFHDTWFREDLLWADNNNFWRIPADLYFQDFDGDYDLEGDTANYYGEASGNHPVTHIYYPADPIDSDPELMIGRIVISEQEEQDNNHEQIQNWIDKLITYETNPGFGDLDYLGNTVLFDGYYSETSPNTFYDGYFDTILNYYFDNYDYIEPTHSPEYPTGEEIIDMLNDDVGLSHFYFHGAKYLINNEVSSTGYSICSLDSYDGESYNGFDNLKENGKYSLCYMISCNPGSYDKSQNDNQDPELWGNRICMAEAFTTYLESKGGPAIVANTNVGSGSGSERIEQRFLEQIYYNDLYHIGWALGIGKSIYNNRLLSLDTTLFGDPDMELWTDVPEYLEVAHNLSTNTITVTCNSNPVSEVSVYFASDDYSTDYYAETDANGQVQCNFNYEFTLKTPIL